MIKIENATKFFGDFKVLDNINIMINESTIYGLIGSNGAGKSTLLKMMCGAYKADGGEITIDDMPVFDNPEIKKDIIYLSDEQYFLPNSNIEEMSAFYSTVYKNFDFEFFNNLCQILKLDTKKKINTFSKGMQKQASVLLGLSSRPRFLFCDETFDGLDPVMRQYVKKLLASDTADYQTTTIIASHNLRELEDICDHIGILHKGGILFERDLDELKLEINNFQCAFTDGVTNDTHVVKMTRNDFPELDVVTFKTTGSVIKMTIRGNKDDIYKKIKARNPILLETLPLTLEEIFIDEMEGIGYDFGNI